MLRIQLNGSFSLIAEVANETSDDEWRAQVSQGQNPVGFTLWHCVRCLDWAVNCAIQGVPEVASEPRWQGMLASTAWFGYEVSMEKACEVAATVSRAELIDYAGEVQKSVMPWLDAASEDGLDAVPDLESNYRSSSLYANVPQLDAWIKEDLETPVWQMLAGTCVSHVRMHYGEVQSQLQTLRSRVTT